MNRFDMLDNNLQDFYMKTHDKVLISILVAVIVGVVNIIIALNFIFEVIEWDVFSSVLLSWVITGLLFQFVNIKINAVIKGILLTLLIMIPYIVLLAWNHSFEVYYLSASTVVLGGFMGYVIHSIVNETWKQKR